MAFLWLINGGDPNHLLTGMILQVLDPKILKFRACGLGTGVGTFCCKQFMKDKFIC